MRRCLTLVGYRGSGKSTLGRQVADALGWAFRDCDRVVEERAGRSIRELFATEGEAAFRDLEEHCLNQLLALPEPWVLATGGGCVLRQPNRDELRRSGGLICYLGAPAAVLAERLRNDPQHRPALSGADPIAEVPEHLARREAWYREVADCVLDASRPLPELCAELVERLRPSAGSDC